MPDQRYIRDSAVRGELIGLGASKCCAYNQSRERFLSADVGAGDFPVSGLDAWLATLAPGSGAALWIVPFRGISPTSVRVPLDLLYLDRNCMVLDAVESFPISGASSTPAASVLALPANTIASAGTRPGDQLILCSPEEMKQRMHQLHSANAVAQAEQYAVPGADPATAGAGGRVLPFDRSRSQPIIETPEVAPVEIAPVAAPSLPEIASQPAPEAAAAPAPSPEFVEPVEKKAKAPRSWLQRLLSPDPPEPRQAARESLQGLSAYFFTGGDSVAHGVRDISPTGFYVFTEERWYPGTIMRMTLTDRRQPTVERSITVNATAVRWGNDGVGLQFVLKNGKDSRSGGHSANGPMGGATKAQIDQFIERLRSGTS